MGKAARVGAAVLAGVWLLTAAVTAAVLLRAEDDVSATDPDPAPSPEVAPATPDFAGCEEKYDAEFSYVPALLEAAGPRPAEPPGFVRFGSGPKHIVVAPGGSVPQVPGTRIEEKVLGEKAILAETDGGYSVEFTYRGCGFSLLGYGLSRGHMLNFALSLVPPPDLTADVFRQSFQDGDSCPRAFRYPFLVSGVGCVSGARGELFGAGTEGIFYLYASVDEEGRPLRWFARAASIAGDRAMTIPVDLPSEANAYPRVVGIDDVDGDGSPDGIVSFIRGGTRDMVGLFVWPDGDLQQARTEAGDLLLVPRP